MNVLIRSADPLEFLTHIPVLSQPALKNISTAQAAPKLQADSAAFFAFFLCLLKRENEF